MSPLFADMPLPSLLSPDVAVPTPAGLPRLVSALDPSTGVTRGLDSALLGWLQNYRPGELGLNELAPQIGLTLPFPEWIWYAWHEESTSPTMSGGSSSEVDIFTLPDDERAWLYSVVVDRASGDNNANQLKLYQSSDYGNSTSMLWLANLVTPTTTEYWPTGLQTMAISGPPGPLMMEPGARIVLRPNGSGVSSSTFSVNIGMRRCKVVRARAPY